jgi:hypothetical protein
MRNRFAFRFFAVCARALRAIASLAGRGAYAATRKSAAINLSIINEHRG